MSAHLEITILEDGTPKIEAKHFTGGKCTEASKPFEVMFGGDVSRHYKAEYYQAQTHTQKERQ